MSAAWRLVLAGGVGLAAATAHAEPRPTEGGIWSFGPGDVVESWEEPTGMVRVHYSLEGPNDDDFASAAGGDEGCGCRADAGAGAVAVLLPWLVPVVMSRRSRRTC